MATVQVEGIDTLLSLFISTDELNEIGGLELVPYGQPSRPPIASIDDFAFIRFDRFEDAVRFERSFEAFKFVVVHHAVGIGERMSGKAAYPCLEVRGRWRR